MQSVAVLDRHQLVWRDPPVWPFAWRGLVPLLALALVALFALGPFARGTIEGGLQSELRAQLDSAGFSWASLRISGQNVSLSGEEPSAGAGERAMDLARSATCPTWSGRRACAVRVAGEFTPPPPVSDQPAEMPMTAAGPAAAPGTALSPAQACDRTLAGLLVSEQIQFTSGSAAIEGRSGPLLDRLARAVRACPGAVRVEGYTDTVGRGRINRALSDRRAVAVRDALIARGVPAERLKAHGYGARRAIADNSTEEGRAKNRRIEFHMVTTR